MQRFVTCACTVFSTSHLLAHLALLGSYYYYPHFADRVDKGTERLNNFPRIVQPVIDRAGI